MLLAVVRRGTDEVAFAAGRILAARQLSLQYDPDLAMALSHLFGTLP